LREANEENITLKAKQLEYEREIQQLKRSQQKQSPQQFNPSNQFNGNPFYKQPSNLHSSNKNIAPGIG
jgi:hypothetical protein